VESAAPSRATCIPSPLRPPLFPFSSLRRKKDRAGAFFPRCSSSL
jgi:hypothetical protein